jgi:hypothetical protein
LEDDILLMLRALPDKSVSVLASGLSEGIIPEARVKEIETEIERVLSPEGGYLTIETPFLQPADLQIETIWPSMGMEGTAMFVKKRKQEITT